MEVKEVYPIDLDTLAGRIAADPDQWVLILGKEVSFQKPDEYKRILSAFADKFSKSCKDNPLIMSQVYQAIQNEEYIKLSGALFGDIWDGTSFLDEMKGRQIAWREEYARNMAKKEDINIDCADVDLSKILSVFCGLVLTTCQDETVEAFWEYEKSMPIEDRVCTPYSLTTSQGWYKRIQTKSGEFRHLFLKEDAEGHMHALIKLYGDCKDSHRMLLSEGDFREYYPVGASEQPSVSEPKTISFLREIFLHKNLLFLGMESEENGQLFVKGIADLLEKTSSDHTERYIFGGNENSMSEYREKYHIRCVESTDSADGINGFGKKLWEKINSEGGKKFKEKRDGTEEAHLENKILDREGTLEQFWKYYIRRSYKNFYSEEDLSDGRDYAEKELYLLETRILGCDGAGGQTKKWTAKSVKQLATAANNLADFYDLEKCFHAEEKLLESTQIPGKGRDSAEFYEQVTQKLLVARLSSQSLRLHRILSYYGGGFPLGFLLLISNDENDLKRWKRAGIQLTNSGIYIKQQHRKNLHERINYADDIMMRAGGNPEKKKFQNRIAQIGHLLGESYFYPFDNQIEGKESQDEIEQIFEGMLHKLHDILRDKSEGYRQIHSLLQTEMPSIVNKIGGLDDTDSFRWKPALIYYLISESRAVPTDGKILKQLEDTLENFLNSPYLSVREDGDNKNNQDIFYGRIMLAMAKIAMECQSFQKEQQNSARENCTKVESIFAEQNEKGKLWNTNEMPDIFFLQNIRVSLLKGKICGRLSTIIEINRCREKCRECEEQKQALLAMGQCLVEAQRQIKDRERKKGASYGELKAELNHLMGEYSFKQSQYCRENVEYGSLSHEKKKKARQEEQRKYEDAEKYYLETLNYYNKYPDRFWMQRADVLRSIADLYCQKAKSMKDNDLKMKSYDLLMDAYVLYRANIDLHGIADVLQSMGNLEDFDNRKMEKRNRSPLCFYKSAKNLYAYLGDEWSWHVVSGFESGIMIDKEKKIYTVK